MALIASTTHHRQRQQQQLQQLRMARTRQTARGFRDPYRRPRPNYYRNNNSRTDSSSRINANPNVTGLPGIPAEEWPPTTEARTVTVARAIPHNRPAQLREEQPIAAPPSEPMIRDLEPVAPSESDDPEESEEEEEIPLVVAQPVQEPVTMPAPEPHLETPAPAPTIRTPPPARQARRIVHRARRPNHAVAQHLRHRGHRTTTQIVAEINRREVEIEALHEEVARLRHQLVRQAQFEARHQRCRRQASCQCGRCSRR